MLALAQNTLAGIVAAIGAIAALVASLAAVMQARKNSKQVIEIHQMVNHTNDVLTARNEQLACALQNAGIKIPDRPTDA